jgi:hypothetical protein
MKSCVGRASITNSFTSDGRQDMPFSFLNQGRFYQAIEKKG